MIPKTPETCPNTSLHVLIVIPKLISTARKLMLAKRLISLNLFIFCPHTWRWQKKNHIQLSSSEIWYLQIWYVSDWKKGGKKHANLSTRNGFHTCVIWHFIDLNRRGRKTSGSAHTIFARSFKTLSRDLSNLFSTFPKSRQIGEKSPF